MVELFIDGMNVDITEENDIELAYTINDVRNPLNTNRSWSKTFDIPGTPNNNSLFKFLFDGKVVRTYNPNLKKTCEIRVDGLSVIEGYVKLTDINIIKNVITYKVVIYGTNLDLFDMMGDGLVSELDFTEYDHTFNLSAVTDTWVDIATPDGFYYPWMNYNSFKWSAQALRPFTYNSVYYNFADDYPFFPAFFVRTIVNKILSTYGFTLNSTFMDTAKIYKQLFIPYTNSADNQQDGVVVLHKSQYQDWTTEWTGPPPPGPKTDFRWHDSAGFHETVISITDPLTLMSGVTQIITPVAGKWSFTITGSTITGSGWEFETGSFYLYTTKLDNSMRTEMYHASLVNPNSRTTRFDFSFTFTIPDNIPKDRKLYMSLSGSGREHEVYNTGFEYTITFNAAFESIVANSLINASAILPNNLKQKDVFKTIINIFNLYVEAKDKVITIEPYNTFFFNDSNNPEDWSVVDWTNKVDEDSRTYKLLSEINASSYLFSYKLDSDEGSKNYKDNVVKTPGEFTKYVENDFVSNQNKIELLPSATIIEYVPGAVGEWYYPSMYEKAEVDFLPSGIIEYTDILFSGYTGILNTKWSWRLLLKDKQGTTPSVTYNGASHYWYTGSHFGWNSYDTKLWFANGDTNYTIDPYWETNLYDVYWKDYIDMINNQNSRLLTMDANLSEVDISSLTFRDIILINDTYYLLNNLLYNPITRQAQVELLIVPSTPPSSLEYDNFIVPDTTLYETQEITLSVDITNNSQGEEPYTFHFYILDSTGGTAQNYYKTGFVPRKSTTTITQIVSINTAGSYTIRCINSEEYVENVPVVVTTKYEIHNLIATPDPALFNTNCTISFDIVVVGDWTGTAHIGLQYIDDTTWFDKTFTGPGTQSCSHTYSSMSMATHNYYVHDIAYYISQHLYVDVIPREPTQGAWTALDYSTLTMHWDSRNECDLGNEWQIATDTGFTNIVQSGVVTPYTTLYKVITGLDPSTYYVTRVRGKATGPLYSVWSGGVQGTTPAYVASFEITSPSSMFSNFGGSGAVCDDATLHITSNCNWSGTTDATWIHGYAGTYSGNAVLYTYVDSNPGTNRGDAITFYYWDGVNEYQASPPQVYLQMADGENCPV